jgi:hypothetical protein
MDTKELLNNKTHAALEQIEFGKAMLVELYQIEARGYKTPTGVPIPEEVIAVRTKMWESYISQARADLATLEVNRCQD